MVRLSAGWVPTQDPNCSASYNDIQANPDYYPTNRRPTDGTGLFPVATQTCRSFVTVPADFESVIDNGTKPRKTWADEKVAEVCNGVGPEVWKFTSLRGSPLFGEWALASSATNAGILARYMSDKASPVAPPPEFATNNAAVTAIRVLFTAMAEPTASKAAPVYKLLSEGMKMEDYK
jgi:hypothetical protein